VELSKNGAEYLKYLKVSFIKGFERSGICIVEVQCKSKTCPKANLVRVPDDLNILW